MAIQYIGTTISGIASDTKPTPTANEKGVIFIETDTNKIYQWDTDSWNQVITSTNVAVGALNSGSITSGFGTIDTGSSNITTTGTITAGNLDVTGTTTTIDSTNTTIADRLIELANGAGSSTADAGIIVERGSTGDNAIIAWDESADTWTIGTTTATGASTGDLSITAGTLVANLTGTASLATVATSTTITDNESTNENNLIPFVANAATATGNHTLEMDGNVHYNPSTGTITAPVFAGALTGNVTGNVSGTAPAGTLTGTTLASGVTASSLTTVGTLTALQVDNLNVNANTITATTGAVNITPAAGSAIVLDGTINVDAGVVTGATSITSTAFVGTIDGVVGGNTPAAITGTTIDANTDFTVGDTVITDGVITDSTGLSIAAAVDLGSNTFTTTGLISGGDLTITGTSTTIGTVTSGVWNAGAVTSSGVVTSTGLTVGSAVLIEADLEQIDDLTAGTATASKALVVDANKDIGTLRNLTIDGTFSDGNYTFDTSGNVSGLGTIGSGAITSSGTSSFATAIQTPLIEYTDGDDSMTIADGGKVTFAAGFAVGSDAAGDMLYHNGTSYVRLAKGTADQILTMNDGATAPGWEDGSSGGGTGVAIAMAIVFGG